MEEPTQFNLNETLRRWRDRLAASPALGVGDLEELEAHLRDSIAALEAKGLSACEAFFVARSRLGTCEALDDEFGKVNVERVWLNRALWIVGGTVAIGALSGVVSLLTNLATFAVLQSPVSSRLAGPLSVTLHLVSFIGVFLLVWRSGKRDTGVVWKVTRWARNHPVGASLAVFLSVLLPAANVFLYRTLPASTIGEVAWWRAVGGIPLAFFWPGVLAWLLVYTARKPLLQ